MSDFWTIWKFPLALEERQLIEMPARAKPLCVQWQGEQPCIWAEVDPGRSKTKWEVHTIGTGHEMRFIPGDYLGTFQRGPYVFHVYLRPAKEGTDG